MSICAACCDVMRVFDVWVPLVLALGAQVASATLELQALGEALAAVRERTEAEQGALRQAQEARRREEGELRAVQLELQVRGVCFGHVLACVRAGPTVGGYLGCVARQRLLHDWCASHRQGMWLFAKGLARKRWNERVRACCVCGVMAPQVSRAQLQHVQEQLRGAVQPAAAAAAAEAAPEAQRYPGSDNDDSSPQQPPRRRSRLNSPVLR